MGWEPWAESTRGVVERGVQYEAEYHVVCSIRLEHRSEHAPHYYFYLREN